MAEPVQLSEGKLYARDSGPVGDLALDRGASRVVRHSWLEKGWGEFDAVVATAHGAQAFTPSVTGRRGRVTASADTSGNHRVWYLRRGTRWTDSEVRGILHSPSNWDTGPPVNRGQHGFILRAQPVPGTPGSYRAWVGWLDIAFGTSGLLANTWLVDGVTLTQGTQGAWTEPAVDLVRRQSQVLSAARIDAFDVAQYQVSPGHMYGLANGDSVNVTGMVDTSFNRSAVAAGNVANGFVQIADTAANNNVDARAGIGRIDYASLSKSHFPRMFAVRLIDAALSVKHWRPEEPEPDWGSVNAATATIPSAPASASGPGLCGLLAAHLHDSSYLEYGDIEFRSLDD